ncbi:glycosyltransferase [Paenibacillus sp. NPDC057967]|uniref:glycosyltransferase n=1 Tax=Paenibacillus sp. NPDC057967 TaxID=3346293 RepID=UPI0036DE745B
MKTILFITNRPPFPNTDGRRNILLQYIKQIKEIHPESQIINLTFKDKHEVVNKIPKEIHKVHMLEKPGFVEKILNILKNSVIRRKWPIQTSVFYSKKTHRTVESYIQSYKPDIVIYDMVRVAEYTVDANHVNVLNYDDLLSVRYQRQLKWLQYIPSMFGGFEKNIPPFLRKILNSRLLKYAIIQNESVLLKKYEIQVSSRFNHLLFTSPLEAQRFKEQTGHNSCIGIPMIFEKTETQKPRVFDENKMVFVGRMDIPHNVSAMLFFCKEMWLDLKKSLPALKLYIIGKSPSNEIRLLAERYPDIIITGEVADVRQEISDSALMIAPLVYGTGIKTKIIEAMAEGIPVATNSIGSEGINITHKVNIVSTDDNEEIKAEIIKLIQDKEYNASIARNAKQFIEDEFNQQRMNDRMKKILV